MNGLKKRCFACGKEFDVTDKKHDLYCPDCRKTELLKDHKKMVAILQNDDQPVFDFAAGVIYRACDDYVRLIKRWHNASTSKEKRNTYSSIRALSKWFKSDKFDLYALGIDGRKLQHDFSKQAFQEIREKRLKHKKKG